MSIEACAAFFKAKGDQAQAVFAERFAPALRRVDGSALEWAARQDDELYRKYRASGEQVNELWANGVFDEEFKRQVLEYFRALLEVFRRYVAANEKANL
ncbi:hypothetical protein [Geoalkalibacter sp.]|uniref:hypothetical protein n=1 Tax=Geoalkalibacter sp. TaxID=3041440 RepID=UPI00272ED891|nr:hypothetical protein [Geoalkalibacter sp.]